MRLAATVVLLRDGVNGPEVFALRRAAGMVFAAGVLAFPGGGVDPTDEVSPPFTGRPVGWWSDRLGLPGPQASSVLAAAVREVFEETGVLLGETGQHHRREQLRLDLAAHRVGLAEVLAEQGIPAAFDDLVPWARWITPPGPPRRYDTFFFVAALPAGQQAALLTTEADIGEWARPADLIADGLAGRRSIMPPTMSTLYQLSAKDSVAETLAAEREITPIRPRVVSGPGEPLRVVIDGHEVPLS